MIFVGLSTLFVFCSLSRYSEIGLHVSDLRLLLLAEMSLVFLGAIVFKKADGGPPTVVIVSVVVFLGIVGSTFHTATLNGLWGYDTVLDVGATKRIMAEGWKGVGAYPSLAAVYDYPILATVTIATSAMTGLSLDLCYVLLPICFSVVTVAIMYTVFARLTSPRIAVTATLIMGMYPLLVETSSMFILQSIGSLVMMLILWLLCLPRNMASTSRTIAFSLSLLCLIFAHILEPYALSLLALVALFNRFSAKSTPAEGKKTLTNKFEYPSRLPWYLAVNTIVIIVVIWSLILTSPLERIGGAFLELYQGIPLGRSLETSQSSGLIETYLRMGEHFLIVAFLAFGLISALRHDNKRRSIIENWIAYPLLLFIGTQFLILFRSLLGQVARIYLWAWPFLIGYAVLQTNADTSKLRRFIWIVLLVMIVAWSYGTMANSYAFDENHVVDYSRGEARSNFLDGEIEAAKWMSNATGTALGDQGAWHLLTAFSRTTPYVDIEAITDLPQGLAGYDWFFYRSENRYIAFSAYGGGSTNITDNQLNALAFDNGLGTVLDTGDVLVFATTQ
jgi:hypothetical protein